MSIIPDKQLSETRGSRFITMDEAVSGAMMALGHTNSQHRNLFRTWADDANKSIGVIHNLNLKDAENIPIKDFAFPIPCDYLEPLEIVLKGGSNINGKQFHLPLLVVNNAITSLPSNAGSAQGSRAIINISEQVDQFVLTSNSNRKASFTHADLKYYALPTDEEGFPLIEQYNKRAIEAYIEYMFVKRERHRMRGKQDAPPQSEVSYLYNQWLTLKADAITKKNRLNVLEADEVVRKWITLLPQPGPLKNLRRRRFLGGIQL